MPRPKGSKNKPKGPGAAPPPPAPATVKSAAASAIPDGTGLTTSSPTTTPPLTNHLECPSYQADDFDSLPITSTSLRSLSLHPANTTTTTTISFNTSAATRRSNPRRKRRSHADNDATDEPPSPHNINIANHNSSFLNQPEKSLDELRQEHERMMRESMLKLKQGWEEICRKYGQDFEGEADEIDLRTGEILLDNGHLRSLRDDTQGNYDVDNWLVTQDSDDEDGNGNGDKDGSSDKQTNGDGNPVADDEALEVEGDEAELEAAELEGAVLSSFKRVQDVLGEANGSSTSLPLRSYSERKRPESPTTPDSMMLEHDDPLPLPTPTEDAVEPDVAAGKVVVAEKHQPVTVTAAIDTSIAQSSFRSPETSPVEVHAPNRIREVPAPRETEVIEEPVTVVAPTLPTTPPAEEDRMGDDAEKSADNEGEKNLEPTPPPSDIAQDQGETTPKLKSPPSRPPNIASPALAPPPTDDQAVDEAPKNAVAAEQPLPLTPTTATAVALAAVVITPRATKEATRKTRPSVKSVPKDDQPPAPQKDSPSSSEPVAPSKVLKGKEKAAQESADDDIWKISEDDPFYDPKWNDRHPDGEPPAHMFPPPPKPYVSVPHTPNTRATPRSTPRRTSHGSLPRSRRKSSASKRPAVPPVQIATPRSGMYMQFMKDRLSSAKKAGATPRSGDTTSSPLRRDPSLPDDSDSESEDELSFLFERSVPESAEKGTKRKRQSLGSPAVKPEDDDQNHLNLQDVPAFSDLGTARRTPKSVKLSSSSPLLSTPTSLRQVAKCGTPGYHCSKSFCFTCIED